MAPRLRRSSRTVKHAQGLVKALRQPWRLALLSGLSVGLTAAPVDAPPHAPVATPRDVAVMSYEPWWRKDVVGDRKATLLAGQVHPAQPWHYPKGVAVPAPVARALAPMPVAAAMAPNANVVAASTNPFGLVAVDNWASPAFVDIDGDGDLDALIGSSGGTPPNNFFGDIIFQENTGNSTNPTFGPSSQNPFGLVRGKSAPSPAFVDIDGDGDLDAFRGQGYDGNNFVFQRNTGNSTNPAFGATSQNPFGLIPVSLTITPTFVDLDGDGDLDALHGHLPGNTIFQENTGDSNNPAFGATSQNPFGLVNVGAVSSPSFVDIDNDGDLDALIGINTGNVIFQRNIGNSTNPSFGPSSQNPFDLSDTGTHARPAFVDIDGDGDLDALIGNQLDGNIVLQELDLFLNTNPATDPTFVAESTNPFGLVDVGSYAVPAFVDIDGDGDLDALIGESFGSIVFQRNTGGTRNPAFTATSQNPFGLIDVGSFAKPAFVDLDGDGDLDALIGEDFGNVVFQRNTGGSANPAFAASSQNPFGLADVGTRAHPAFVDIDDDGDLDALIGNSDGNTIFQRNTGNSTNPAFGATSQNPFGLVDIGSAAVPTFVDIDGDNDLDALIGNSDGNTIFQRNTGNNIFPAFGATSQNPFDLIDVGVASAPAFVDIDGDGDLDALIGRNDGNTIFQRNGPLNINTNPATDPTFFAPSTNPFGLAIGGSHTKPVFVDIDGDGDLDALTGRDNGHVVFQRNTGGTFNPAFGTTSQNPFGLLNDGFPPRPTPHFVDIDGDGDLDALIGTGFGNVIFQRNTGNSTNPTFGTHSTNPFGLVDVGDYAQPTFVDIDGDGDLDALIGNGDGNTIFQRNTGNSTNPLFSAASTNPFGLADVGTRAHPAFVDIDGDGDLDALFGTFRDSIVFQRNTGNTDNPAFGATSQNPFGLVDVGPNAAPDFVDIDGDGDLDAFSGNTNGNFIFQRNGPLNINTNPATDPTFIAASTTPFGLADVGARAHPAFVDIDGDGDLDALIGNEAGNIIFQRNTGGSTNPTFGATSQNPFGLADAGVNAAPTFVDIDGDGDLDALIGNNDGNVIFQRNTGGSTNPTFGATSQNPFGLATSVVAPTFVDLDDDGDLDALFGGINATTGKGQFVFQQNTGNSTNPAFAAASTNPFGLVDFATEQIGDFPITAFVDIDGDGDIDAFAGNKDGNTVFQRNTLNTDEPGFGTASTNPFNLADVGSSAQPTFVDIDGDGDLDAFIGNKDGNVVFQRNGPDPTVDPTSDPAFAAAANNPFGLFGVFGGALGSPAFVDIDGDGDLDAFAGLSLGERHFHRNTGNATNPAFSYEGANPFGLNFVNDGFPSNPTPHFVDIDGDGDLDAFVGTGAGNFIFQANTGNSTNPTFGTDSTNPFGLVSAGTYARPTFVDLDGDGDLDAITGNGDGNWIFQRNTGDSTNPTFAASSSNPFGLADVGTASAPVFLDIDGDGDLDAVAGNGAGNFIFQRNTGDTGNPAFGATSSDPFGLADVGYSNTPTFVDIDGDGDLDAFAGNSDGNWVFQQNTSPVTSGSNPSPFASPSTNPNGLADVGTNAAPTFVDLDGDGDLDAISGNGDGNWIFQRNTGNSISPTFATASTNPFGLADVGTNAAPTFVDLDGDGDLDAISGNGDGNWIFQRNTGNSTNPTFDTASTNPFGLADVGTNAFPAFVDLDGDGDLDAVSGNTDGNWIFQRNTGDSTNPLFATASTNPFGLADVGSNSTPSFVDTDQDGDFDALSGNAAGEVIVQENTGNNTSPTFAAASASAATLISSTASSVSPSLASISYASKGGGGTARMASTNPFGIGDAGSNSSPVLVDIDNDNDLDAITGNAEGNWIVQVNTSGNVLPVELTAFTAIIDGRRARLMWETASETNNAGFEVERQDETSNTWQTLAFVEGQGTTLEAQRYTYDAGELPPGTYRFRLQQRDFDGTSTYSPTVEVTIELPSTHLLSTAYPNPFQHQVQFELAVQVAQQVQIEVFNMLGQRVRRVFDGELTSGITHHFRVSGDGLSAGSYVIRTRGEFFKATQLVVHVQ